MSLNEKYKANPGNSTIYQDNAAFKIACTSQEFEDARILFRQYADSLDIDLSFQDFNSELETIDIQYNKPLGALIIAYNNDTAVGCVAIRELMNDIAELKRMYVLPESRGLNLGRRLLEQSIEIAQELGYSKIRLDTLPSMATAIKLYRSFGFYDIPPYRFNPVEGAIYMEKILVY